METQGVRKWVTIILGDTGAFVLSLKHAFALFAWLASIVQDKTLNVRNRSLGGFKPSPVSGSRFSPMCMYLGWPQNCPNVS